MTPTLFILTIVLAYTIGAGFGLWIGYRYWYVPGNTQPELPTHKKVSRGTNVIPLRKKPKAKTRL